MQFHFFPFHANVLRSKQTTIKRWSEPRWKYFFSNMIQCMWKIKIYSQLFIWTTKGNETNTWNKIRKYFKIISEWRNIKIFQISGAAGLVTSSKNLLSFYRYCFCLHEMNVSVDDLCKTIRKLHTSNTHRSIWKKKTHNLCQILLSSVHFRNNNFQFIVGAQFSLNITGTNVFTVNAGLHLLHDPFH